MRRFGSFLQAAGLLFAAAFVIAKPAIAADLGSPPAAPLPSMASPPIVDAPKPLYLRFGVSGVFIDQSITARVEGQRIQGGGVKTGSAATLYTEAGYFLTPNIAASVSAGFPPKFTEEGTGTLAPFGTLSKARVGIATATVHYHADLGSLHPYLGGGLAYAIVFHDWSAGILHPTLRNNFGAALVAGLDIDIRPHWTLFFDVKNVWITQHTTGLTAPFPGGPAVLHIRSETHNDVVIATTGLGYRF